MAQISVFAQPGLAFMGAEQAARENRLATAQQQAAQAAAEAQQRLRQQAFTSLQGAPDAQANPQAMAAQLAAAGDTEGARLALSMGTAQETQRSREEARARQRQQDESDIFKAVAENETFSPEGLRRRLQRVGSDYADASDEELAALRDAYRSTEAPRGFTTRDIFNPQTGRNEIAFVNPNTGETRFSGIQARQSDGQMVQVTGPGGYTVSVGSGAAASRMSTTPPGMGPQTPSGADARNMAAMNANFLSGPESDFFRLTGRLTEAGAGGAGALARGAQELAAQLGGGISFAEFLLKGDAELGPGVVRAGNDLMQRVTGLSANETAQLRTATALTRARLAPLVAPQGYGIRFTDWEREAIATSLGDLLDPTSTFEALQGNRHQVFVALAIDDARKSIAAGRLPPFVTQNPDGSANTDQADRMFDVMIDEYGFSERAAADAIRSYNQSLNQLYRFNQEDPQEFVRNVERIQRAQRIGPEGLQDGN
jgi:hypothetical protein